jgi:hypothetical protein
MSNFFEETQLRPRYIGVNDKSVIIPFAKQEESRPLQGTFQTLRARIINHIITDCNAGQHAFKNTNIDLVVDPQTKEVLLSATGNGRICLNTIDPTILQRIVNEEIPEWRIKIIR